MYFFALAWLVTSSNTRRGWRAKVVGFGFAFAFHIFLTTFLCLADHHSLADRYMHCPLAGARSFENCRISLYFQNIVVSHSDFLWVILRCWYCINNTATLLDNSPRIAESRDIADIKVIMTSRGNHGGGLVRGYGLVHSTHCIVFESRSHSATCSDDAEISFLVVGMSLATSKWRSNYAPLPLLLSSHIPDRTWMQNPNLSMFKSMLQSSIVAILSSRSPWQRGAHHWNDVCSQSTKKKTLPPLSG